MAKFKNKLANIEIKDDKHHLPSLNNRKTSTLNSTAIDNRRFVNDVSEYWDYLNSGRAWDLRQDGLLYFIIDCFYEIENCHWLIDDSLSEILSNVRNNLSRIVDVLVKVEEEYKVNLSKFTVLINECIDRFPNKKLIKIGKNFHIQGDEKYVKVTQQIDKEEEEDFRNNNEMNFKGQNDVVNMIFKQIKTFIMKKKINVDDFCDLFQTKEVEMPNEEFKMKIGMLLGDTINSIEIDDFIKNMNKKKPLKQQNTIKITQVFRKLKKYYDKERKVNLKEILKDDNVSFNDSNQLGSLAITIGFKNVIEGFAHSMKISDDKDRLLDEDAELRNLVETIYEEINPSLVADKTSNLYIEYIKKLGNSFRKIEDKLYLLKILKYLIKKYDFEINEDESSINDSDYKKKDEIYKKIQWIFNQAGVNILCINYIKEGINPDLLYEATNLLIFCLKRGNREVQSSILEHLMEANRSQSLFNFIKSQLWYTLEALKKEKQNLKNGQANILKFSSEDDKNSRQRDLCYNLIMIIQYFCENCFLDFQVIFKIFFLYLFILIRIS